MDSQIDNLSNIKLSWKNQKKQAAKHRVIATIPTVTLDPNRQKTDRQTLDSIPHFYHPNWHECHEEFYGRPQNDCAGEYEFQGKTAPGQSEKIINTESIFGQLQVVETFLGAKLMESESVPIFILCPRNFIDSHDVKANADVLHLDRVLSKYTKKICGRDKKKLSLDVVQKNLLSVKVLQRLVLMQDEVVEESQYQIQRNISVVGNLLIILIK
jgi:hypothetical protein